MTKNKAPIKRKIRLPVLRPLSKLIAVLKHSHNTTAFKTDAGFTLVEVLIASVLLTIVATGILVGLITASRVLFVNDSSETAKNLAETQMEFVKQQTFIAGSGTSVYTAAPIPSAQSAYSISINVISGPNLTPPRDSYLQEIIITVTGPGSLTHPPLIDFKVN